MPGNTEAPQAGLAGWIWDLFVAVTGQLHRAAVTEDLELCWAWTQATKRVQHLVQELMGHINAGNAFVAGRVPAKGGV